MAIQVSINDSRIRDMYERTYLSASTGVFMSSTDMAWDTGAIPMWDSPIVKDYTKVEPFAEYEKRLNKCEYCRSVFHDDGTGSCKSCGAPGGLEEYGD